MIKIEHACLFVYGSWSESHLNVERSRDRLQVSALCVSLEWGLWDCSLLVISLLSFFSQQTDYITTAISHKRLEFFSSFLLAYLWRKVFFFFFFFLISVLISLPYSDLFSAVRRILNLHFYGFPPILKKAYSCLEGYPSVSQPDPSRGFCDALFLP